MNGILNVLKPPGMTSFDVVGAIRHITKVKKIGHTGTLDPAACGVLPICIGSATRAIEYITNKDKQYRAELTLGVQTDTQDSTGEVLKKSEVNVTNEQIEAVLKSFVGTLEQVPPMYSAVKINGEKLYNLARQGITIEREPRKVTVYGIDIINIEGNRVIFDVRCSKGTYVRTLCNDAGEKLGCGGHMSFLIRTKAGDFDIKDALTFEEISDLAQKGILEEALVEVDKVFSDMPDIKLGMEDEKRFLNGAFIKTDKKTDAGAGTLFKVYNDNNQFIALGELIIQNNRKFLKSKRLFI